MKNYRTLTCNENIKVTGFLFLKCIKNMRETGKNEQQRTKKVSNKHLYIHAGHVTARKNILHTKVSW